ncbi:MAG: histidine phosphatase family protein [Arcanobacterium sp.]|nr:histidine phosphatase family protein [Arcanobacterium sp.]
MAKKIVFWRHGQTDQNIQGRIQGATDNPLNQVGLEQAGKIAPEIAKLGVTKIFVSDLLRAQQTAQAVAEILHLDPVVDSRLRERSYGKWEGLTAAEIKAGWPEEFAAWRRGEHPQGVGVQERGEVGELVGSLVREQVAIASDEDVLLFVAHGGSIVNGVMNLLGMNPNEWAGLQGLDNCHWALLEERPGANPGWRIRSYNRTVADIDSLSHLWR